VGVDHAAASSGDREMHLGRAGLEEQQITRPDRVVNAFEPSRCDGGDLRGKVSLAHRIRRDRRRRRSDPLQCGDHEADAIEAAVRLTPAKAERRSDEALGSCGELVAATAHAELGGKRVSRSLPGKDGSPWKLIELAKRAAHVAIV